MLCPIFRNPSAAPQSANKVSSDPSQRIQNLNFLVQQIKTYYLVSFGCSLPLFCYLPVSYIKYPSFRLLSFPSLSTSDYDIWTFNLDFSILPQFASSVTHTLAHTCADQIVGSTCVPADQLVLLKMHALNISHVHKHNRHKQRGKSAAEPQ